MTVSSYRTGEVLYTVISRDADARSRFQKWSATSKSIQARVEENRMHIFDHNTLSLFVVTWAHSWDNLLIWDVWAKRHIFF